MIEYIHPKKLENIKLNRNYNNGKLFEYYEKNDKISNNLWKLPDTKTFHSKMITRESGIFIKCDGSRPKAIFSFVFILNLPINVNSQSMA